MSSPVSRSCAWLGWLDGGPVRSSIFVEKDRRGPFLKIYPCFPRRSQQEAGDHSTDARTGVDPCALVMSFESLGPRQWVSLHPCRATRCLRGRWCESGRASEMVVVVAGRNPMPSSGGDDDEDNV